MSYLMMGGYVGGRLTRENTGCIIMRRKERQANLLVLLRERLIYYTCIYLYLCAKENKQV